MFRSPPQKLQDRVGYFKSQATLAAAGDVQKLHNFPVINPYVVACVRKKSVPECHARSEKRRVRAHASTCLRYARALSKLAKSYVYRPGKTEEFKAVAS